MADVIFDNSSQNDGGVAETSKKSYKELKQSGELGDQADQVFKALKAMPYLPTIDELAHEALAGWQKSTISGRLNDLKDLGLIEDLPDSKRESKYSGVSSKVWRITSE